MTFITTQIKWIMLITGLVTCSMFQAFLFPENGLNMLFGASIDGPIADVVVRNWGALIGIVGMLLIFGAFKPHSRPLILILGAGTKIIFIGLILIYGSDYLETARGAIIFDSLAILLYLIYLIQNRRELTF
ncbi:MAG: hypothetical protein COB20_03500 [SAR86 cluster bacterium]|uniref:DUF4345 domain-containing protein n=1 Tax=SAR86 cluster bacterium TaxID=2030880 RepID=A0A2A4XC78_9GAMM|nr:MAG: hypothetical protein COB20_03500 [SAR86 cluster bacterium]